MTTLELCGAIGARNTLDSYESRTCILRSKPTQAVTFIPLAVVV